MEIKKKRSRARADRKNEDEGKQEECEDRSKIKTGGTTWKNIEKKVTKKRTKRRIGKERRDNNRGDKMETEAGKGIRGERRQGEGEGVGKTRGGVELKGRGRRRKTRRGRWVIMNGAKPTMSTILSLGMSSVTTETWKDGWQESDGVGGGRGAAGRKRR